MVYWNLVYIMMFYTTIYANGEIFEYSYAYFVFDMNFTDYLFRNSH